MITTQIDDLVGRPTGVKTQAFLYVLCGLAEAAVYVALLPLLRSLIAGDYVAAGYLVALAAALALLHSVIGFSRTIAATISASSRSAMRCRTPWATISCACRWGGSRKSARGRLRLCSPRSCRWPWTCLARFCARW